MRLAAWPDSQVHGRTTRSEEPRTGPRSGNSGGAPSQGLKESEVGHIHQPQPPGRQPQRPAPLQHSDTQSPRRLAPKDTSSGTSGGATQTERKSKKNKNTGWKKDTPRRVIDYMSERLAEWYVRREEEPLWYSTYVYTDFNRVNNIRVPTMEKEYSWILADSYYHAALVVRGEVK